MPPRSGGGPAARRGVFRVAPLAGETTWSLIGRIATRYGLDVGALLGCWQWGNHRPRHEGGRLRADAEVLLDPVGRRVLAELCGVGEEVLARALPAFRQEDPKLAAPETEQLTEAGRALWRVGGAAVGRPVAVGCGLCAARRTGTAGVRVVRYVPRWERVCARHGRWLLDADADLLAGGGEVLEFLDLRELPEVVAARRRWGGVARRAVRAGAEPERVFALAHAVVARWWEQALHWEREEVWPRRLHLVAGGDAGGDLEWWRIVGRDAVVFPEVVAVADALLDPAMAELVWVDSGGERPRPLPADGAFCRRLGERVGRPWLGPLAATDFGGPLTSWMGSVIRLRRGAGGPPGYGNDPWWLRQEHQSATMAGQLRVLGKEKKAPGSGRMWRAAVPAEERALITSTIASVEEQLLQLRGVQTGPAADVTRRLLRGLGHSAALIDNAWRRTALAAANSGIPLEEVAQWAGMTTDALRDMLAAGQEDDG
ncbi:DNA-binding protein [Actinacidiphila glaucinigra]|uniref:DNA-binding protein n=1 Tax=Actinacidiphila glaucinigra TaxID=235986 RepID=UPI0036F044D8